MDGTCRTEVLSVSVCPVSTATTGLPSSWNPWTGTASASTGVSGICPGEEPVKQLLAARAALLAHDLDRAVGGVTGDAGEALSQFPVPNQWSPCPWVA